MAFITDKEELKPGLIIFRRGDVDHRNWYCRIKLPKADRYKTISLKTSDKTTAMKQAFHEDVRIQIKLEDNSPIFNRPFSEVAADYVASQERRAATGAITRLRVKKIESIIKAQLNPYVGTTQVHLIGHERWDNFDGILMTSNADQADPSQRAYTQVYRSGSIEAVASSITMGDRPEGVGPRLTSIRIEGQILLSLVKYLKGLQSLGVEPPFALMISLTGIKGVRMNVGIKAQWHEDDDICTLDRDQFHFGEVIIETVPNSVQECAIMIRPFIEQLANTAGRASSSSFGPNGEYLPAFSLAPAPHR